MRLKLAAGFTLIELSIVIGVMAVLATIIVSAINPLTQIAKGRDTQRKADLLQLQSFFEQYRHDAGVYPAALPACGSPLSYTSGASTITYLTKIPCDPKGAGIGYNSGKFYYSSPAGSTYTLAACLEYAPAVVVAADPNIQACPGAGIGSCSSTKCYVVTNP